MGTSPFINFTMIIFDELRITNDGEYLVIDARVRKEKIYKNVTIKEVWIGTHKNYSENGATGIQIPLTLSETTDPSKRILMRLSSLDINSRPHKEIDEVDLKKDLIYVYIETTPLEDIDNCPSLPCDMMSTHNIGVTMYMSNFYNTFMNYIKEIECINNCEGRVPQNLIDFILRYITLTTAIDSKHFIKANELFEKWFSGKYNININSSCGCNG